MKKIFILTICFITTLIITIQVSASTDEYSEVREFFTQNFDEMISSYNEAYGVLWEATKIEDITDVYDTKDNKIGYLIVFDEGYLAYRDDMSVLEVNHIGYPSFYTSTFRSKPKVIYNSGRFENSAVTLASDLFANDIYYPLDDYYLKTNFTIHSSMVQIPYFKDVYDSSSWGNYMGISFSYLNTSSGLMSTLGLMYTLKVNNIVDLTIPTYSYLDMRAQFYVHTNFDPNVSLFTNQQILSWGINDYLDFHFGDRYDFCLVNDVDTYNPAVTLYYNSNADDTAEYCMRVGFASEPSWFIFNTYYDIVMANSNNFFYDQYDAPIFWFDDSTTPFYLVNQNYRNEMFQFFEGDTLLK